MYKVKHLGFLLSFFLIIVTAFSQDLEYREGYYYKKDMLYTGNHVEYYENGKPKIERNIKNGIEDGLVITYYENGEKQEQRSYKEGKKDGLWDRCSCFSPFS